MPGAKAWGDPDRSEPSYRLPFHRDSGDKLAGFREARPRVAIALIGVEIKNVVHVELGGPVAAEKFSSVGDERIYQNGGVGFGGGKDDLPARGERTAGLAERVAGG